MRVLIAAVASAISVGTLFAGASAQDTKPDPKRVEAGAKIYASQKCSMCHSVAGKGNAAGKLDDVGSRLSEEEIRQWLINPRVMTEKAKATRKPLMPAYTKLKAEELDALVAYMKSLTKK